MRSRSGRRPDSSQKAMPPSRRWRRPLGVGPPAAAALLRLRVASCSWWAIQRGLPVEDDTLVEGQGGAVREASLALEDHALVDEGHRPAFSEECVALEEHARADSPKGATRLEPGRFLEDTVLRDLCQRRAEVEVGRAAKYSARRNAA